MRIVILRRFCRCLFVRINQSIVLEVRLKYLMSLGKRASVIRDDTHSCYLIPYNQIICTHVYVYMHPCTHVFCNQ